LIATWRWFWCRLALRPSWSASCCWWLPPRSIFSAATGCARRQRAFPPPPVGASAGSGVVPFAHRSVANKLVPATLVSEMTAAGREHWKPFLIEGIVLVVLGLAAMIVPPLASLAVTIFLGWMFLI